MARIILRPRGSAVLLLRPAPVVRADRRVVDEPGFGHAHRVRRAHRAGRPPRRVHAAEDPQAGIVTLGGARSLINVPMIKENELIGIIVIYRQEVRLFTDKQVELLHVIAGSRRLALVASLSVAPCLFVLHPTSLHRL